MKRKRFSEEKIIGVLKEEAGVGAGSKWRVPDFREVCAPCHGRY